MLVVPETCEPLRSTPGQCRHTDLELSTKTVLVTRLQQAVHTPRDVLPEAKCFAVATVSVPHVVSKSARQRDRPQRVHSGAADTQASARRLTVEDVEKLMTCVLDLRVLQPPITKEP